MADAANRAPRISVSSASSDKRADSRDKRRPSKPRIYTDHKWNPHPWYYGAHTQSWKRQVHDPHLEWHIKWTKDCFPNGRVLIIDYLSNDAIPTSTGTGSRQIVVAAQEFETLKGLQNFYADPERTTSAALRVIHVQNARWATDFLLRKFNIDNRNEMIGMQGFSKWAKYNGPLQRNGKPFPNGRSWREQTDPWRSVSRTAFGLDYMKVFKTPDPREPRTQNVFGDKPIDAHMMHLNTYNDDSRSPFGYDVSVQRMNVYIQRNLGPPAQVSPEDQTKNPYAKHSLNGDWQKGDESKVHLDTLDNSSTVIIFETSSSLSMEDCLIQPRNEFESRWRRLTFYLRKDVVKDDARLAAQCTNMILADIFHGLAIVWQSFLAAAANHVNILEDKIYDNPADESRAPELWTNQAAWLKVDKVMYIHQDLVKEMQGHLHDMANVEVEDDPQTQLEQLEWLSGTPAEYDRLSHSVQEDLVQPVANLSDLMYKSVGIRDSRQSLQLGLSMWRLSWITFIFLPLTFAVGFFGMNVSTFGGPVGIGYYFVAAVIIMIFVLVLWYCVKHSLQQSRQTYSQRGTYQQLFNDLEDEYPLIWSRDGAIQDVQPQGFADRIKWDLIKRWFAPDKTINKKLYQSLAPGGDNDTDLGSWQRFKKFLLQRWLPRLNIQQPPRTDIPMADIEGQHITNSAPASLRYQAGTITQLAKMTTPIAMAEAEPTAVQQISTMGLRPLTVPVEDRRKSSAVSGTSAMSRRRYSEERPSSRGSSGIMFEERNLSDSESDVGEGASSSQGKSTSEKESASQ